MKISPIILLVLGVILAFSGLNGTLGTLLASIFTPNRLQIVDEED